ncbi:MAG: cyclase family protein [Anaerolineae bacterium]|nr:cyclase family protein [Anaerolineae bacterium]
MPIVDLSHPITSGMPVYPGDPAPTSAQVTSLAETGYVTRQLVLGSHTGTHIDAPAHMLAGGPTLSDLPIATFIGLARVLHLPVEAGKTIALARLAPHETDLEACGFLVINTGWHRRWGQPDYFANYPTLSVDAANWLARQGLKGVGLDTPSADGPTSQVYAVHHALLGAGMVIVENLTNLDALPDRVTFSAFPLPIAGADGSPVRAIAIW